MASKKIQRLTSICGNGLFPVYCNIKHEVRKFFMQVNTASALMSLSSATYFAMSAISVSEIKKIQLLSSVSMVVFD